MEKPNSTSRSDAERRHFAYGDQPGMAGMPMRDGDIESTTGLHSIAILFRVMACLLGVIIVLQLLNGLTSSVEISYGVLIAEIIRLVIFAGLLWAAGDLADLFIRSHHDLRAARIYLARLTHQAPPDAGTDPRPGAPDSGRGRGDATH